MASLSVSHLAWTRPGGDTLFDDVSFHIGPGSHAALIGVNGVGKTTLLRLLSGDLKPDEGTITVDGTLGVMRQLVGSIRDSTTVRDLFVSIEPERIQNAAARLAIAEASMHDDPLAYADALAGWGDVGGYEAEVHWDACAQRVLGANLTELAGRRMATLSGGQQKRLALECLLRGEFDVLLLDEPDNFLDIPGKRWLEGEIRASNKTVLYVSHDRQLLANSANRIVTLEAGQAWTHGGALASYYDARTARIEQLEKDLALYQAELTRLQDYVKLMRVRAKISEAFAPRLKAAESRLRQFEARTTAPVVIREQNISMRLTGSRSGKKVLMIEGLAIDGLTDPFDLELWFGDRVAVLGGNGVGKSHFMRVINNDGTVSFDGDVRLGAGVVVGLFNQTHDHPELFGRTIRGILEARDLPRGAAMSRLQRYELTGQGEQAFETLSGGQQARFMILLLELDGANLLLLDEPTDNLDLDSAQALQDALARFEGTVVAVTHDRWFLRDFDRFVLFDDDCAVHDLLEAPEMFR